MKPEQDDAAENYIAEIRRVCRRYSTLRSDTLLRGLARCPTCEDRCPGINECPQVRNSADTVEETTGQQE